MIGSRISWIFWFGGSLAGLSRSRIEPSVCRTSDQIEVVLALKPLLDDVHMKQAEEAATKAESHRLGTLGLKMQGGVVELELVERFTQSRKIFGVDRKQA